MRVSLAAADSVVAASPNAQPPTQKPGFNSRTFVHRWEVGAGSCPCYCTRDSYWVDGGPA